MKARFQLSIADPRWYSLDGNLDVYELKYYVHEKESRSDEEGEDAMVVSWYIRINKTTKTFCQMVFIRKKVILFFGSR